MENTIDITNEYYLEKGESRMDATKKVAQDRNVSKREIYGKLNN